MPDQVKPTDKKEREGDQKQTGGEKGKTPGLGHTGEISDVEAIILVMVVGGIDLVEAILTFVAPGFAEIVKWLINFSIWPLIQFYLIMKGIRGVYYLYGSIMEFIPLINFLPMRTAAIIFTIYMSRHPELLAKVQKLMPAKKSVK